MSFSQIYGHSGPKTVLQRAIAAERVSHAYLFEGAAHTGKTLTAKAFAKALMCATPPEPGEPCGACHICRAVDRENHPDYLRIEPRMRLELKGDDEGGEDEAADIEGSMINVEAAGKLISFASCRTSAARRKVAIVSSAEAMNAEAANRILKTLEEPPGQTTIVLTASSTSGLLPTIVSRCQLVRFGPVPVAEAQEGLEQAFPEIAPDQIRAVAMLSGGRPGWAIRLLQHREALQVRTDLLNLIAELPARPMVYCMKAAEGVLAVAEAWWQATSDAELSEGMWKEYRVRILRTKMGELLDMLLTWFRDIAIAGDEGDQALLINTDRASDLHRIARVLPVGASAGAARAIREAQENIAGNAQLRMAVEVMLIDIWRAVEAGDR